LTQILGDYGADVVWVEPPGGDPLRNALSIEYSVFNRNKRSIEVDLKSAEGRSVVLDLAARADVFVQSWRLGVADRLGLGPAAVRAQAPGLIYCSITGFGTEGALTNLQGREGIVHAIAGTTAEQVGMRVPPIYEGLPFASIGAAYLGAVGILASLVRRGETGMGCEVETSMFDGALAFLMMLWGDNDKGRSAHLPGANKIVARSFECADGEYIGVHTGAVGAFGRLMKVLGLDDRIPPSENSLEMGMPLTEDQAKIVAFEIPEIFQSKPRAEWLQMLRAADICAVEHFHPGQCFDQPQVRHNGMVVELQDPVLGVIQQVGSPIRVGGLAISAPTPAPESGSSSVDDLQAWDARPSPPVREGSSGGPLQGIKVLDLGAFYAGPYASRLLADLGADVIKIEPTHGDPLRGLNVVYRSANAGKRSIAMNLKDDQLAGARTALIEWADVIHHNMRPGVAERLGLGYDQVREVNDEIVYLYAPGWGSTGPDVDRQSFAPKLAGYVGGGFEVAGRFNPPLFPVGNEDPGGGLVGAIGILLGLLSRNRSGESQYVESPQLNGAMTLVSHIVRTPDGGALGAERLDTMQYGVSALDRLYATTDGWICLNVLTDQEFDALSQLVGDGALNDARFADQGSRQAHDEELGLLLESGFAQCDSAHWEKVLREVDVPVALPCVSPNSLNFLRDPQNRLTRRVAETDHERDGKVREIDQLIRFPGLRLPDHRVAPDLGSSTASVLHECGYDEKTITMLKERGAIV
jgi:crotonobetainyl-CoA:carnitine CoA-transferase CaiB-like acyl-CoA transferase